MEPKEERASPRIRRHPPTNFGPTVLKEQAVWVLRCIVTVVALLCTFLSWLVVFLAKTVRRLLRKSYELAHESAQSTGQPVVEINALLYGLPRSGRTSLLYQLKLSEFIPTVPTVETVKEKFDVTIGPAGEKVRLTVWDVGRHCPIIPTWRQFHLRTDNVIFVIDSTMRNRFNEAREELFELMFEDHYQNANCRFLILANKQDVNNAINGKEVESILALPKEMRQRWRVVGTSAVTGNGIKDGIRWLAVTSPGATSMKSWEMHDVLFGTKTDKKADFEFQALVSPSRSVIYKTLAEASDDMLLLDNGDRSTSGGGDEVRCGSGGALLSDIDQEHGSSMTSSRQASQSRRTERERMFGRDRQSSDGSVVGGEHISRSYIAASDTANIYSKLLNRNNGTIDKFPTSDLENVMIHPRNINGTKQQVAVTGHNVFEKTIGKPHAEYVGLKEWVEEEQLQDVEEDGPSLHALDTNDHIDYATASFSEHTAKTFGKSLDLSQIWDITGRSCMNNESRGQGMVKESDNELIPLPKELVGTMEDTNESESDRYDDEDTTGDEHESTCKILLL